MNIDIGSAFRVLQAVKVQPKEMGLMFLGVKNSTSKIDSAQSKKLKPNSEMQIKAFVEDYKRNPEMACKWIDNVQSEKLNRKLKPNSEMQIKAFVEDYKRNPEMACKWLEFSSRSRYCTEQHIQPTRPAPPPPHRLVTELKCKFQAFQAQSESSKSKTPV